MELEGIRDLIFSDRYALKEPNKEKLEVGDKVVVIVSTEGEWEQRSVATITSINDDNTATMKLHDDDSIIIRPFSAIDKCLEKSPKEVWNRMSHWLPIKVELPELASKYVKEYEWLLENFKFMPGGRINASLGSESLKHLTDSVSEDFDGFQNTLFNCFVIDIKPEDPKFGKDSREAIMDTLKNMVSIQALGGGIGIPLSVLRPSNAYIQGVNGKSSGSVSWGSLYSEATSKVSQGGSRRGALLLGLNINHPDIIEFIFSKVRKNEIPDIKTKWQDKFPRANFVAHGIENANISVFITDDFMEAVKENKDWDLIFPDYELVGKEVYNKDWTGDINEWIALGHPVKVYDTIKAKDLWDCISESAWRSAEPGIIFIDRIKKEHNGEYYDKVICTNPCGEIPLPSWNVCLLGHINLPEFIEGNITEGRVNWEELRRAIHLGVRFLDSIIEYNPYHDIRNEEAQKNSRRIGLGTLGLGEALIRLGLIYGKDSLKFIDELYKFIAIESYIASINLAEEKGAFPKFEYEKFIQSEFMKRILPELPEEYVKKLKETGIRNVCINTAAPTGSTGTLIGTSTGIEPYFSFSYWRSGRLGVREVKEKIVQEYLEQEGKLEDAVLPDCFVTANTISPDDHILVQGAIQKWVDQSISKSINLPKETTVDEVKSLYTQAYDLGIKGTTIYRNGSRDIQVLSEENNEEAENKKETIEVECTDKHKTHRPNVVHGQTEKIDMPGGKLYVTTNSTDEDGIVEVFINGGESNSEVSALCNYVGRLISVMRKNNIPLSDIIKHGNKVPGGQPFWYKGDLDLKGKLIANIPSVLSHVLNRFEEKSDEENQKNISNEKCPSCKDLLRLEEGCMNCPNCGYSKCV